jgi:transcription antitermination factor NusG
MNWFALRCRSNFEYVVAAALEGKGYSVFLPTVPNSTPSRKRPANPPLFPGYVFGRFNWQDRLPILTIPGLVHIVGNGRKPLPIPDGEVDSLRIATAACLPVRKHPYLAAGEEVLVDRGPLAGARGVVCRTPEGQSLVVSISILQRSVSVELLQAWITPVQCAGG